METKANDDYKLFQSSGSGIKAQLFDYDRVLKLMDGAIDLHVHASPEAYVTRMADELDLTFQACRAGMKALVFKCHATSSVRSAKMAQKVVNQWADQNNMKRTDVFGGVVLNYSIGGLNPEAVVCNYQLGGKYIWTAAIDSSHHRKQIGQPGGIEVLDENKEVVPVLKEILCLIAETDMVLGLCHQSAEENLIIIDAAREVGVKRIELVHPLMPAHKMTIEEIKIAVDKGGVYAGLYCWSMRSGWWGGWDEILKTIEVIGPEHLVLATDAGIFTEVCPVEAMRTFIAEMLVHGVSDKDVERMVKTNSAELLY